MKLLFVIALLTTLYGEYLYLSKIEVRCIPTLLYPSIVLLVLVSLFGFLFQDLGKK